MNMSESKDSAASCGKAVVHFGKASEPEESPRKCESSSPEHCSTFLENISADESKKSSSEDDEYILDTKLPVESKYGSFPSFLKLYRLDSDSETERKKDDTSESQDISMDFDLCEDQSTSEMLNDFVQDNSASALLKGNKSYGKQQAAYESCKLWLEAAEHGIKIHDIPNRHSEVISLPYPSSVTLHGYLRVSVLLGRASILGYEIPEGKSSKILSIEGNLLLKLSAVKSAAKHSIGSVKTKLRPLFGRDQEDILDDFLSQIGPSTTVVVLERRPLPPSLMFLEFYFPHAVQPIQTRNKNVQKASSTNPRLCSFQEEGAFTVSSDMEWLADEINRIIIKSTRTECGPRIAVCGPKHSGKSSLLRYLINNALNQFKCVYYLDIDPGQTEFTPPGTVSLTRITEPLLGPPFSHNQSPLKMVFTGAISAATSPPMYIKGVLALIEIYKNKFAKEPLFVNTMGWIDGIGEICLNSILKQLETTVKIELIPPHVLTELKKVQLPDNCISFCVPAQVPAKFPTFSPKDLRNFILTSYFGKCQKYYMEPQYFNAFRPVVVCWDNIAVYVMDKKLPANRLIEAMHCSVVALCRVSKELILDSDRKEYPRTLFEEPLHDCIGFGFIRASDEKNRLFYIVTPLSLDEIRPVNALIKGNVLLPDEIILKQPIENVPLPYTDTSKGVVTRKRVRNRSRKSTSQMFT